jgi:putative sugar O-methyltransferase
MMTTALQDNIPLLDKMMADLKFAEDVYKPSAFWCDSMTETARALRRYGLKGFRSNRKATPGLTWTDAPNLSVCDYTYKFPRTVKGKLVQVAFRTNIFRKLLDVLDRTVRSGAEATYFTYYKFYRDYWVNAECYHWFSEVLKDHSIPNCMVGEPIDCIRICNQLVSPAYLGTLARICNFNDDTDFKKFRTMFIIGGGFGYEVHLIMSLFPNIKKCITLDMPPNLYVQTQYLKAVMKEGCIDYLETCRLICVNLSSEPRPRGGPGTGL